MLSGPPNKLEQESVLEANRRFYEAIAPVYEKVDRRRAPHARHAWLRNQLETIRATAPDGPLVDLGSGSGFLANLAVEIFPEVIAVDISPAMLEKIKHARISTVCSALEKTPLAAGSAGVVTIFAALHHVFDPLEAIKEAFRILKPGGILYTDHDMEACFARNFRVPLQLYRALFDHGPSYLKLSRTATAADYECSEFHGKKGINGAALAVRVSKLGFTEVNLAYHWQGLLPIHVPWRIRGFSPLLRLHARK